MLSKEVLRKLSELNRRVATTKVKEQVAAHRQHAALAVSRAASRQSTRPESTRPESTRLESDRIAALASQRMTQLLDVASRGAAAGSDMPRRDAQLSWRPTESIHELPDGRVLETPHGPHYVIERPLYELWDGAESWLRKATRGTAIPLPESKRDRLKLRDLQRLHRALPDSAMFLDLETCGFSGSMVFLAGVLVAGPKGLTLIQLLARHYGEEQAIMHTLWQIAAKQTVLATFNGKSFDWPVVRDRTVLHRLDMQGPLAIDETPHCDLLHMSRRRWKRELPNCKLQTLERFVCGRRRSGDIPGRDIPDAYHQFVRTKDAWEMRNVLHHNALDLVTLLQLSLTLLIENASPNCVDAL